MFFYYGCGSLYDKALTSKKDSSDVMSSEQHVLVCSDERIGGIAGMALPQFTTVNSGVLTELSSTENRY